MVPELIRKDIFIKGAEKGYSEAIEDALAVLEEFRNCFAEEEDFKEMEKEIKNLA